MNFFGRNFTQYETKCPVMDRWIPVQVGLPADPENVMTLVRKEHYDGTHHFMLELQKFFPSDGWKGSEGVIAWKECDPQMLSMMKEKQ